ncbi:hypothetical protein D3C84_1093130 [compost metagenome]
MLLGDPLKDHSLLALLFQQAANTRLQLSSYAAIEHEQLNAKPISHGSQTVCHLLPLLHRQWARRCHHQQIALHRAYLLHLF